MYYLRPPEPLIGGMTLPISVVQGEGGSARHLFPGTTTSLKRDNNGKFRQQAPLCLDN